MRRLLKEGNLFEIRRLLKEIQYSRLRKLIFTAKPVVEHLQEVILVAVTWIYTKNFLKLICLRKNRFVDHISLLWHHATFIWTELSTKLMTLINGHNNLELERSSFKSTIILSYFCETFFPFISTQSSKILGETRIQDPVKHLWWSLFMKIVNG